MTKTYHGPRAPRSLLACALGLLVACTSDLQEAVGPTVPFPDVSGRILRDGTPVAGIEVEIEDTVPDTTYEDEDTDANGRYAFTDIGPGEWSVRVDSEDPGDFERATYDFRFVTDDTTLVVPDIDISRRGLALEQPADGEAVPAPSPFAPMSFSWSWPPDDGSIFEVRVRFTNGSTFWTSSETAETTVDWNGLGNDGQPIESGDYEWQIRLLTEGELEYRSESRSITFE
jgi:hypothetical protein